MRVKFDGEELSAVINKKQHSIKLIDNTGLPYMTCTKYVEGLDLEEDQVLIKNYSENEGVLNALIEAGIVTPAERLVRVGHEWLHLCRFTF